MTNEYGRIEIGHVNGNVTVLENAKVVKSEVIGWRPEEGSVKEYTVEYKSGRTTSYVGCWYDEK